MQKTICRWGILGTANIARKNWQAIRWATNCSLVAVASRDLDRCRRYIAQCQQHVPFDPPPRAIGSYEELLASDDVDAVYIPLPTGLRKQWVLRAAAAGSKQDDCQRQSHARSLHHDSSTPSFVPRGQCKARSYPRPIRMVHFFDRGTHP